jgi:hypothetical protein
MEECQIDDMSQYYSYYDDYATRLGKKYLGWPLDTLKKICIL